ncbi:MAG: hypothetical protein WCT54_02420 [Patescibacteria group bacterium]
MDLLGFFVWAFVVLFPPIALREQIHQAGIDIETFLVNQVPWRVKQIKSFFVGRLVALSALVLVVNGVWAYSLFRLEPQLAQDPIVMSIIGYATLMQAVFAMWNYANGRLRYHPIVGVTVEQRTAATSAMAQAQASRETSTRLDALYQSQLDEYNHVTPPPAALVLAALAAGAAHVRRAEAYGEAADANAAVRRTSRVLACSVAVKESLERVARIRAVVPDPVLDANFNTIRDNVMLADRAAEAALVEQDNRVFVWSPFGTRWSRPDIWLASVIVSMLAMGMHVHIYAVAVEDRWLVVMSYVPFALCFLMTRISAEVLAWLVLKGTKLAEFILTKTAQLAVAVLPGDTLATVRGSVNINILEEEKITAAIKEWVNLSAVMVAPYAVMVFWITSPLAAAIMGAVTMVGAIFGLIYISRGKKTEVDENTTKTIGWFWKYGKWITAVIFLLGSSVEWDGFMNRFAGITPMITIPAIEWGWYIAFAGFSLIAMWASWKVSTKWKGKPEKVFKPIAAVAGVLAFILALAPVARAATHGRESFQLSARIGQAAEKPVDMTLPAVTYEKQANGREQLVITFYSRARQAKGVVEFDSALAVQLGVERQVMVKTYNGYADCGGERCRHHEVRIPELKSRPHGTFKVIMRRLLTTEVGEEVVL